MAVNWESPVKWKIPRKMQPIKSDTYTYILKNKKKRT